MMFIFIYLCECFKCKFNTNAIEKYDLAHTPTKKCEKNNIEKRKTKIILLVV